MAEYLLRKGKINYEIAKFEDSDEPTSVYVFGPRGCTCPGSRFGCKHKLIFNAWKKAGEIAGAVYNDDAKVICYLAVS